MNGNLRRIIIVVVVFVVLLFGFVWIVRKITNRGEQLSPVERTELVDYANTDTVTKMVINGKIIGNDEYGEVHITVGRDSRTLEIVRGYEGNLVRSDSFDNNESAYKVFLSALHNAGFTRSRGVSAIVIPEGSCPTGKRFWYQVVTGDEAAQSLWSTSCASVRGSFAGNTNTTQWLFENQIPDFDERTEDVDL